jgi:hypothetical protein
MLTPKICVVSEEELRAKGQDSQVKAFTVAADGKVRVGDVCVGKLSELTSHL